MTDRSLGVPHVVIVGGGFGGLATAREFAGKNVRVTLIDRSNHHLFQPLLYQVAIAGLSPADIAAPIRAILRKLKNVTVLMAEAVGIDFKNNILKLADGEIGYDYLVLAVGGRTSYFGNEHWEQFAPGLKDLDDAVEIRRRVLTAFEAAERETDRDLRQKLLTFVVVGGGPTGVELAGAIAELSHTVLARDFRNIDPRETRVILLEGGPRILASFSPELSDSATRQLNQLGVNVRLNTRVTNIDENGAYLANHLIRSATIIWGAGIQGTAFSEALNVAHDRAGRLVVEPDLSVPGHSNVFAIGDMSCFTHQNGKPLPGVSPVAMQMGRTAARNILASIDGRQRSVFSYFDKGSMATIGRQAAVAEMGKIKMSGLIAWLAWLFVHLIFLIGFRNRISALFNWAYSYFTYERGARLITGRRLALILRQTLRDQLGQARQNARDEN